MIGRLHLGLFAITIEDDFKLRAVCEESMMHSNMYEQTPKIKWAKFAEIID